MPDGRCCPQGPKSWPFRRHGTTSICPLSPAPHAPLEHGWRKRGDRCGHFLPAPLGAFARLVVARASTEPLETGGALSIRCSSRAALAHFSLFYPHHHGAAACPPCSSRGRASVGRARQPSTERTRTGRELHCHARPVTCHHDEQPDERGMLHALAGSNLQNTVA